MPFFHVHAQIVTSKCRPQMLHLKSTVQYSTCQVTPLAQFSSPRSVECQEAAAAGADNFNSLTALSHLPLIKTWYF